MSKIYGEEKNKRMGKYISKYKKVCVESKIMYTLQNILN